MTPVLLLGWAWWLHRKIIDRKGNVFEGIATTTVKRLRNEPTIFNLWNAITGVCSVRQMMQSMHGPVLIV